MSDLFEDEPAGEPGSNAPEFSVSEISGAVKKTIEGAFGRIRVRGEVGRVFRARSGHLYYDIKDDRNVLACTTWKGQLARLSVQPEEGLEVIVTGKLTTFGAQSKYNMNVEEVEVAGEGALMAMLEKRKKALAAEGLFAEERKRPLPYLPEIIGVITSPSGAVIRDILHRLRDRFPRKVLVWPVAVQGKDCAPQVAAAIDGFNRLTPGGALPRPDVLIVARGGGSIEDLWGFNEEIVARAAAASEIPLISAVGHETDTTLIDYVSDRRAPTPTAAAEMAVPVRLDLLAHLDTQSGRLTGAVARGISRRGERLRDLARALPRADNLLATPRQRLDTAAVNLPRALRAMVDRKRAGLAERSAPLRPQVLRERLRRETERAAGLATRLSPLLINRDIAQKRRDLGGLWQRMGVAHASHKRAATDRLAALDRVLTSLNYEETLKRGYAIVRDGEQVITSTTAVQKAASLELQFADGRVRIESEATTVSGDRPKSAPKPKKPDPEQGSLF